MSLLKEFINWLVTSPGTAAAAGIIGNRADAALMSVLRSPDWQQQVCENVAHVEDVRLDRRAFLEWLNDPMVWELLARNTGRPELANDDASLDSLSVTIRDELILTFERASVLKHMPPGHPEFARTAEQVILTTLLALPLHNSSDSKSLLAILRDTSDLREANELVLRTLVDHGEMLADIRRWLASSERLSPNGLTGKVEAPFLSATLRGRDGECEELAQFLSTTHAGSPAILGISGLSGIGKTQLVAHVADRQRATYEVWVDGATSDGLVQSFARLAELTGLTARTGADLHQLASLFRAWLQAERQPWLLVIDNAGADVMSDLRSLLPREGTGHIVVISTEHEWMSDLASKVYRLSPLSDEAAVALLKDFAPSTVADDAQAICARLGGVPQAIVNAGRILRSAPTTSPSMLFSGSGDIGRTLLEWRSPSTGRSIESTIIGAIERAMDPSSAPFEGIACLALLTTPMMDAGLLADAIEVLQTEQPTDFHLLVGALADLGVLQRYRDERLGMNALAHDIVLSYSRRHGVHLAAETMALHALSGTIKGDPEFSSYWVRAAKVAPHLLRAIQRNAGADSAALAIGYREFVNLVALPIMQSGDVWTAGRLVGGIAEGMRNSSDRAALRIQMVAAWVEEQNGRRRQALETFDILRNLQAELFGPDDPDTLLSSNHFGRVMKDVGDKAQALDVLVETTRRRARVLGEDHRDTLVSENNLGLALRALDRLPAALEVLERVYRHRLRRFGPDDIDTLRSLNNVAQTLARMHEVVRAMAILEEVLERRSRNFGPQHPDTIAAEKNLGLLLFRSGTAPKRAGDLLQQAYHRSLVSFGAGHPSTVHRANVFGRYLSARGEHAAAAVVFLEASNGAEQSLDDTGTDMVEVRTQLAASYEGLGEYGRALDLYWEVLRDRRRRHEDERAICQNLLCVSRCVAKSGRLPRDDDFEVMCEAVHMTGRLHGYGSSTFRSAEWGMRRISLPEEIHDRIVALGTELERSHHYVSSTFLVKELASRQVLAHISFGDDPAVLTSWLRNLVEWRTLRLQPLRGSGRQQNAVAWKGSRHWSKVAPTGGFMTWPVENPARDPRLAEFQAAVEKALRSSAGPVQLGLLGSEIGAGLGSLVLETEWFGYGGLSRAVKALHLPGVVVAGQYVWVEGWHSPPRMV